MPRSYCPRCHSAHLSNEPNLTLCAPCRRVTGRHPSTSSDELDDPEDSDPARPAGSLRLSPARHPGDHQSRFCWWKRKGGAP